MLALLPLEGRLEPGATCRPPDILGTPAVERVTLFVIARSKNANIVVYDYLPQHSSGVPLDVYWRMHAEDGRREELTALERRLAYGFRVDRRDTDGGLVISLRAAAGRSIRVPGGPRGALALTQIDGQEGQLERIFVRAQEGSLLPRVKYVELFGRNPTTRARLTERVYP